LVSIGVEHPDLHFEIVYGVSDNRRAWYDNGNAKRLGYQPQDSGEGYGGEVRAKEPPVTDQRAETFQGGTFVTAEAVEDPSGLHAGGTRAHRRTAAKSRSKKRAARRRR